MNIQAEKIGIMKLILETDNPEILKSIKKLFNKNEPADFWETLPREQKDEIIEGIKEIDKGDVIDYEKFISKHR